MVIAGQILFGLILLAAGGEGMVRGAVGIARRFGLSELMIGLTLVGFGTSTPELVTSINAALAGSSGIALGNVLGSNIGNLLLILGLIVLVRPLKVNRAAVTRDCAVMIAASFLLVVLGMATTELGRAVGAVLLALLAGYVVIVWRIERQGGPAAALHQEEAHTHDPAPQKLWLSALFAAGGLVLLIWGADVLVGGAIAAADAAGVSETVIGLTVVAVGTSLPELVASLTAAMKGRSDVALGNIVGSNIYNVLGILGGTALVSPVFIPADIRLMDWAVLLGSAALAFLLASTGSRLTRLEGAGLVGAYCAYVGYLLAA